MTLAERYAKLCDTQSAINQHLPTLRHYASQCESAAEFGVDIGQSTTALLMGQPELLISVDVVCHSDLSELIACADSPMSYDWVTPFRFGQTSWRFLLGDSRLVDLEPVDLLFIDSAHSYDQLSMELARHHSQVKRYLIFHDTVTFGKWGEGGEPQRGLTPAITEFLAAHPEWTERERFEHCNGLLVLERRDD